MRLLLSGLLLLGVAGVAFSQVGHTDSVVLIPVPAQDAVLPSLNILTPAEVAAFTARHGLNIVRTVDKANTYRWSDGTKTITFPPEMTTVTICRQDDADGNTVGYLIMAFNESGGLPDGTKAGLLRKLEQ